MTLYVYPHVRFLVDDTTQNVVVVVVVLSTMKHDAAASLYGISLVSGFGQQAGDKRLHKRARRLCRLCFTFCLAITIIARTTNESAETPSVDISDFSPHS